jgi:hypothetical protein
MKGLRDKFKFLYKKILKFNIYKTDLLIKQFRAQKNRETLSSKALHR